MLLVSAGAGPTEARTFVALLAARFEQRLRARGVELSPVHTTEHRPLGAAPRSVALGCRGPAATAAAWVGTHELVHAARGRGARQRWFAAVPVHDYVGGGDASALSEADVEFSAARAGGPGGQRVNKVASAVRAVHRPSGISVRVAEERSQRANRRVALQRIAAQLGERDAVARAAVEASRHREHRRLVRGGAVCSYRLVDGELELVRGPDDA